MDATDYWALHPPLGEFVLANTHISDDLALAERLEETLSAEQRRAVTVLALHEQIRRYRRANVREIERAAVRAGNASADQLRRWERDHAEALEEQKREEELKLSRWRAEPSRAPKYTRIYKDWAGSPEGKAQMEAERVEREKQQAEEKALYEKHGGRNGYMRWQWEQCFERIRDQGRLALTKELLGSSFSLGDGRTVTWEDAEIGDHTKRFELLMKNVEGNAATAKLHQAAVRLLEDSGARSLGELAREAA